MVHRGFVGIHGYTEGSWISPYKNKSPVFFRGLSGFRPRWTSPLLFRDLSDFTSRFV